MRVAKELTRLQTTTTATSLATGAVGWGWGNILDTANLHAGTGKGTESGLSTWTWGLGSVTCKELILESMPQFEEFLNVFLPPVARILTWRAVMPNSLQRVATS